MYRIIRYIVAANIQISLSRATGFTSIFSLMFTLCVMSSNVVTAASPCSSFKKKGTSTYLLPTNLPKPEAAEDVFISAPSTMSIAVTEPLQPHRLISRPIFQRRTILSCELKPTYGKGSDNNVVVQYSSAKTEESNLAD